VSLANPVEVARSNRTGCAQLSPIPRSPRIENFGVVVQTLEVEPIRDLEVAAMNLHLAEIATRIAPAAHAVLLVDQAGWHLSDRLIVPPNITMIALPAKCPELNPQETSGSSCATTGSQIGSSIPSTTSSITAATHGTSS
jgi:hypothetical protein